MTALTLTLALCLPGQSKADPDQFPLALHRSMEIDDLDREIQKIHDTVLLKRGQLASSQRLAARGLVSRGDLERETSDLRYQEAREAETIAYRAIKAYERDVIGQAIPADENKAYSLLLDWVRKQQSIAQVDADFRAYTVKQTRALLARKAVSKQEMEDAELALDSAQASVALSRSREAQVLMELAARRGEKPYDPVEYHRLKGEYLKARVRYFEVTAEGARRRLEIARDRVRSGLIPTGELGIFERASADAEAAADVERKSFEKHQTATPDPLPKPRQGKDA
jgi:hypothetical protein